MTPKNHDLDQTLSTFFRGHMPAAWPPAPATPLAEPARPATAIADAGDRSRWALALSIAGLLGLGLTLSAGRPTADRPTRGTPSAATGGFLQGSTAEQKGPLKEVGKARNENPMR